jgi:fibronectin type 3 domain-containing protein
MKAYKKLFIKKALIALSILIALKVSAQEVDKAAINGNKGIYIYNVFNPASAKHPDGEVIGFRLDRKEQKETNWQTLYQFSTPASYEELSKNFEVAKNKVFEYRPATAYTPEQVWPVFKKTFNYDSVGAFVTQQAMAAAFNVLLIDTTAKKGLIYQYKLMQIKKDGTAALNYTSDPVSTNDVFVANKPRKTARKADANLVKMEWRAKLSATLPEALLIHRSDGINMPFYRYLATYGIEQRGDSVIYTVEDEQIKKEQLYQYAITPVNRFGGGAAAVSDTIYAVVVDEYLLTPKIFNVKADSIKNKMVLNWSFMRPDFISAVSIYRSTDYENGYQLIGSTSGYNYIDNTAIPGQKYYYYLIVTDKMGRTGPRGIRAYGLMFKTKKSATPTNIGLITKNKQNIISWTDVNNDTRGYYIYRTNQFEGELKVITEMIYRDEKATDQFSFTDTATNLAGKVGYAVVSENLSNVRSDFSRTVYIENSTVGPTAPTIIDFKNLGNNIHLFWLDRATDKLITGYNIYRKIGKADFIKVNKVPVLAYKTSYKDSVLLNDQELSYKMTSVNTAGLESSFSDEMIVQIAQMVYAPSSLKSYFGQDNKNIILQWQPSQSEVAKYEIYRYVRGTDPTKIADVNAKVFTYTDTNFIKEKNNYYFIKTIGVNGKTSLPSAETYAGNR